MGVMLDPNALKARRRAVMLCLRLSKVLGLAASAEAGESVLDFVLTRVLLLL
jgi:hypothetical protein